MPLLKLLNKPASDYTKLEKKQLLNDHRILHMQFNKILSENPENMQALNKIISDHTKVVKKLFELSYKHYIRDKLDQTLPDYSKKKSVILSKRERLKSEVLEDILKFEKELIAKPGLKVNLGAGTRIIEGFINLDKYYYPGIDIVYDVEPIDLIETAKPHLPFRDNTVGVIIANHFLEHIRDQIGIMNEIWRVLYKAALFFFEVPSTDGPGSFADPSHKSYWNKLSFEFFTDDRLRESRGILAKFEIVELEEREDLQFGTVYITGQLKAVKP